MIKIEVNGKNQEVVTLKCKMNGAKDEIADEIYVILKHLDTYYSEQMMFAVGKIVNEYRGSMNG